MAPILVSDDVVLDSTGTDGLTSEVSQVVALDGSNAVQMAILVFALTATTIVLQLQVSVDGNNFADKGTNQTFNGIGRKLFTIESSVTAPYARIKYTMTGAGKIIFKAWINVSPL